ncbi:Crp/Fnr family transcriptional regulator [Pseudonocardia kunmingensis]|uniref:CRP-like cAMP-binding protein n=1 Tax=Pseudonocardia kunmingensis TaxID=630975 RepID=A0A543DR90_9PSEU|nr:Crp/Fnr family transcriptional regulator [Pseudonocardia kunmingensis]TQM11840.1 CRP-like cAMP-binding protein [Pseudonocardia kunmingensis]
MQGETTVDGTRLTTWMRSVGRWRSWEAGAIIFREGEPATTVLLIESGRAKAILSSASGKQVMLAVRGSGDLLGEFAALDGQPRSATVQALSAVRGWLVTSAALVDHLSGESSAALELLRLLVGRLREADMQRLDFGALDTTGRVANFLIALTPRHVENGWLYLTQTELGESVGASREATVKALRRLRDAGLIETARGRIRVLRPDNLAQVADGKMSVVEARARRGPGRA